MLAAELRPELSFSATMARFSSAFWTSARSSVVANGFVTKSYAPRFIASMAVSSVAVRGHHDDLGARVRCFDEGQQIEPAAVRHHQIRQDHSVRLGRVARPHRAPAEARARA